MFLVNRSISKEILRETSIIKSKSRSVNKMEILLSDLTQAEIQEIIDNSNHTSYESIKEFHDDGLLEVFPSADDVWSGYSDDEKLTLSTGKVVLFIGG